MPAPDQTGLRVEPVRDKSDRKAFLELPYELYRDDPAWVPPLRLERRMFLDPAHNPFLDHADVELFLARRGGQVCGRMSAHVDREEERIFGRRGATFGQFEARDEAAARLLLETGEAWARERGALEMRGPFTLSINQETGLLIDGFDVQPMMMMPHNPQVYASWIEACGYEKVRDMYAWRLPIGVVPEPFRRAAEKARRTSRAVIRPIDLKRVPREIEIVRRIFNAAWSKNWGFIPMTDAEVAAMARDLKLIADPRIAVIAEQDGEPVGIGIGLPNLNEALAGLGGRLFPTGLLRLLWRLKVRGVKTARMALMGVVAGKRGMHGLGISALMMTELHDRSLAAGYREWEISWVLEENRQANQASAAMGSRRAKTYRVYRKDLTTP